MNCDELLDVIKNAYKDGYNAFGVRVLPSDVDVANIYVGADVRDSYDWDFESDCSTYDTTGETLGGGVLRRVQRRLSRHRDGRRRQ